MHGEQARVNRAGPVQDRTPPRAGRIPLLLAGVVTAAAVAGGLAALWTVEMPASAKFAILAAMLVPVGGIAFMMLRQKGAIAATRRSSRSRLLRRAADAVDEPRAVLGPTG